MEIFLNLYCLLYGSHFEFLWKKIIFVILCNIYSDILLNSYLLQVIYILHNIELKYGIFHWKLNFIVFYMAAILNFYKKNKFCEYFVV